MSKVRRHENESLESLLKRFRRSVNEEGILKDLKSKEEFISPSEERRIRKNETKRKIAKIKRREQSFLIYSMNNKMVNQPNNNRRSGEENQGDRRGPQAPRVSSPRVGVAPRRNNVLPKKEG